MRAKGARRDTLDDLRTVEGSTADQIRGRALDLLNRATGNDVAFSLDMRPSPEGYRFANVTVRHPAGFLGSPMVLDGKPCPPHLTWDPVRPPRTEVERFVGITAHGLLRSEAARWMWRNIYEPVGVTDQARTLLYHDRRFVGFVGLLARGPTFSVSQLRRLNGLHDALTAAFVAAQHVERPLTGPAYVVLCVGGTIEHACERSARWLDDDRRAWLVSCIRALDQGLDPGPSMLHGVRARFVRLYGASGARYLASLEAVPPLREDASARLSGRQREIAEYAAVGATKIEIGVTLGLSPQTVAWHLKEVYRRLGVSTRVELADALREEADRERG